MDKLQDLSQSELQELLDNPERVESMALESDEVMSLLLGNVYSQHGPVKQAAASTWP